MSKESIEFQSLEAKFMIYQWPQSMNFSDGADMYRGPNWRDIYKHWHIVTETHNSKINEIAIVLNWRHS